jgi:hypothetical protein
MVFLPGRTLGGAIKMRDDGGARVGNVAYNIWAVEVEERELIPHHLMVSSCYVHILNSLSMYGIVSCHWSS